MLPISFFFLFQILFRVQFRCCHAVSVSGVVRRPQTGNLAVPTPSPLGQAAGLAPRLAVQPWAPGVLPEGNRVLGTRIP